MFFRAAIVWPLVLDSRDDARLIVSPMNSLDAGHVAQRRFDTITGDQQPRFQR